MLRTRLAALPLLLLLASPAARADITASSGKFEFFAGWLLPENDISGQSLDDYTLGLRGGYHFTPRFSVMLGLQKFHTDIKIAAIPGEEVDVDELFVDVPFVWSVNPESKAVFQAWAGVGYALRDFDYALDDVLDDDADTFSLNFGLGGEIAVTDHFYLRPEGMGRWLEGNDAGTIKDGVDWQAGLAFGWYIGK